MKKAISVILISALLSSPVYGADNPILELFGIEPIVEESIDSEDIEIISNAEDIDEYIEFVSPSKLEGDVIEFIDIDTKKDKQDAINGEVDETNLVAGSNTYSEVNYWSRYSNKYVYENELSDVEKDLWDQLDVLNYSYLLSDIQITDTYIKTQFTNIQDLLHFGFAYRYFNPQFFFLRPRIFYSYYTDKDGEKKYSIFITSYDIFRDGSYRASVVPQIKSQLDSWTSIVDSCTSDYFKAKTINDLICQKVSYDDPVVAEGYDWNIDPNFSQSIYSVICRDKTVCAGYSLAYSALCNSSNIISSSLTGCGHAWNTVYINGKWYIVDSCWNDGYGSYKYFLVSRSYCASDKRHIQEDYWTKYTPIAIYNYRSLMPTNGEYYGDPSTSFGYPCIDYDFDTYYSDIDFLNFIPYTSLYGKFMYNNKIPNIKRSGYLFDGWYLNGKVIKKYNPNRIYDDVVIKAQWTPITYNVSFVKGISTKEKKGVSGVMGTMKKLTYDQDYILPDCGYIKPGYKFVGWADEKKNPTKIYTNQDSIKNLSNQNNKTVKLFAIWEKE